MTIERRRFTIGRELAAGEPSKSGAYALVDIRKGKTLRIALDVRISDLLRGDSRAVYEAWLV